MRHVIVSSVVMLALLGSVRTAAAYELRLIATSPSSPVAPGDFVSYDLYLDTQGESGIVLFSVGLTFDPSGLAYRPDLSDAEDYYPLYAPAVGKTTPATWLVPPPGFDPPQLWPVPPPGLAQVNVDFIEVNLGETVATATNLYLATLTFEVTYTPSGPENIGFTSPMNLSFDNGGNIFNVGGVDVSDQVGIVNTGPVIQVIPEPTTALLLGLGLCGLGVARRRAA
jgi:hypothetical protein